MEITRFAGGTSNPTYLVTGGDGRSYVLRKKPSGALLESAHQIDREYAVMAALDGKVPVPAMRLYCADADVIGEAFYVMDHIDGRIFRDASLPNLSPADRAAVYAEMNDTLASLHAVDPPAVGLGDFGRHGGYFSRQIARWTKQFRAAQSHPNPDMDALIDELPRRIPAEDPTAIVHGDYRLENIMFHRDEPRLIAVLDWELSTLGHPLADLGYNAFLWRSANAAWGSLQGVDLDANGIPSERDYVARYCARTGRADISDWPFYLAFAAFRLAAIAQGAYRRRIAAGTMATENQAPLLARQAIDILRNG